MWRPGLRAQAPARPQWEAQSRTHVPPGPPGTPREAHTAPLCLLGSAQFLVSLSPGVT